MFSKISRYRKLPEVVGLDAQGRVLVSKALRLLPEVKGDHLHVIEQVDRLDHLAYKYYGQPRNWWRIVDANPAFLSPQALLGKGPEVVVQIPLTWQGPAPPWSDVPRALLQTLGVDEAVMGTPEDGFAEVEIVQGPLAFDIPPALAVELDADARGQQVGSALSAAMLAQGVTFASDVRLEKPDAVTWRITDVRTRQVFTFQFDQSEGLLNVYRSATHYHWVATVTYNSVTVSVRDLLDLIEGRGFRVAPAVMVRRVGKSIVIPPRAA